MGRRLDGVRVSSPRGAAVLAALVDRLAAGRGVEERRELLQVLLAEVRVRAHDRVPELGRVRQVPDELGYVVAIPHLREIGSTQVPSPLAHVRVAIQTARD